MAVAKRPLFYNGPKGDEQVYNLKDPAQMALWEASWAKFLGITEALEQIVPEHRGGGKAPAPRYSTNVDNDDLNYEAWLTFVGEIDAEIRAEAFEVADDLAAAEAFAASRRPTRHPVTQDGMYRMADGAIAKVQIAVNGSGNLYAKRLVVGDREGRFEYEPGLIRKLAAEDRMSVEDAAEFGKLYGFCCVCGRTLTDETSIAAGIGPVCAGRME